MSELCTIVTRSLILLTQFFWKTLCFGWSREKLETSLVFDAELCGVEQSVIHLFLTQHPLYAHEPVSSALQICAVI